MGTPTRNVPITDLWTAVIDPDTQNAGNTITASIVKSPKVDSSHTGGSAVMQASISNVALSDALSIDDAPAFLFPSDTVDKIGQLDASVDGGSILYLRRIDGVRTPFNVNVQDDIV